MNAYAKKKPKSKITDKIKAKSSYELQNKPEAELEYSDVLDPNDHSYSMESPYENTSNDNSALGMVSNGLSVKKSKKNKKIYGKGK